MSVVTFHQPKVQNTDEEREHSPHTRISITEETTEKLYTEIPKEFRNEPSHCEKITLLITLLVMYFLPYVMVLLIIQAHNHSCCKL